MSQLSRRVGRAVVLVAALSIAPAFAFTTVAGARHATHKLTADTTVEAVKSSKYGTILVTASGRTLYMLTAESAKKNVCTARCTAIWPQLTTKGTPEAGKGVNGKLLGTIDRGKGVLQVTYKGQPLYLYSGDTGKGQANGEGIASFGGTWYVLNDAGVAVTAAVTSSSGSSGSGGGW